MKTTEERKAVALALLELSLVTARAELDEPTLAAYLKHLDDLEADAVLRGIQVLCRSSTYFPPVAEIRRAADGLTRAELDMAWGEAMAAVQAGRYQKRDGLVSDPVRRAVKAIGGWQALGNATESGLVYLERAFRAAYPAAARASQFAERLASAERAEALAAPAPGTLQ